MHLYIGSWSGCSKSDTSTSVAPGSSSIALVRGRLESLLSFSWLSDSESTEVKENLDDGRAEERFVHVHEQAEDRHAVEVLWDYCSTS